MNELGRSDMRVALSIVMAILTLGLASEPTLGLQVRDDVSPLQSIQMIDAQNGWAVTARCGPCPPHRESGLMLRTTSGGTQWLDVTPVDSSGQRSDVAYFYAFNSHIAWVEKVSWSAALTTEIFRTVDGGRTWKGVIVPAPGVSSISFINPREGWLLASIAGAMGKQDVEVYRSTDGGENWIKVASTQPGSGLPLSGGKGSITFLNPTTGWIPVYTSWAPAPADSLQLYVTRDGGRTWRQQDLPKPPEPQQNQPLPPQVTRRLEFVPWSPKFFTAQDGILRVDYRYYLVNESTGDIRETRPVVVFFVTHDSGRTWTYTTPAPVKESGDPRRRPSNFVDVNHGWVKEGGALYLASDGGHQWTTVHANPLFADVIQLDFISPKVGWAVRNTDPYGGGARQAFPFLLNSLDGGRTWAPVPYAISR